ncbi:hypothetical protein NA57DRAFT_80648 [Rhizodiscina lignyota]|uniref:Uncharacterized protein n=1 Tax=Rhizodiscina lignyota TaxID=1504668 RepID=A0A9P4I892_9PEZI|nr:hypothetical protein NA57DRAFT_80648 [Rhizodiscina lignyota]
MRLASKHAGGLDKYDDFDDVDRDEYEHGFRSMVVKKRSKVLTQLDVSNELPDDDDDDVDSVPEEEFVGSVATREMSILTSVLLNLVPHATRNRENGQATGTLTTVPDRDAFADVRRTVGSLEHISTTLIHWHLHDKPHQGTRYSHAVSSFRQALRKNGHKQ